MAIMALFGSAKVTENYYGCYDTLPIAEALSMLSFGSRPGGDSVMRIFCVRLWILIRPRSLVHISARMSVIEMWRMRMFPFRA